MGNYKIKSTIFFVLLIISSQTAVSEFVNGSIDPINHELTTNSLVVLDTFPVNLDLLFWEDDPSVLAASLNTIGNYSNGWIITPWGGHFVSNHIEGADKFYLYANRYLEVYAPADGSLDGDVYVGNGAIDNFHGNDVITDTSFTIDLGSDCYVGFGHLHLLKSVFDVIDSSGDYNFTEGELIGYTPGSWALDFLYYQGLNFKSINPYKALNTSLKEHFTFYYNMQYERATKSGLHPESIIENEYYIHINNTLWGVWVHNTSRFDSIIDIETDVSQYQPNLITALHRNLTNPETFYRNPINRIYNLTSDVIGLFTDNAAAEQIGDYVMVGNNLVKQISGDELNGILEFRVFGDSDWGSSNTTIFARYEVNAFDATYTDDILTIEYYDDLLDAEAGFTLNNITYTRFTPNWDTYIFPVNTPTITPADPTTEESNYSFFLGQTILFVSFVVLLCVQKKKKIE